MQLRNGHIKLRFARIFEQHHFVGFVTQVHCDQAHISADTVFFMHDRVADIDFGKVAQQAV